MRKSDVMGRLETEIARLQEEIAKEGHAPSLADRIRTGRELLAEVNRYVNFHSAPGVTADDPALQTWLTAHLVPGGQVNCSAIKRAAVAACIKCSSSTIFKALSAAGIDVTDGKASYHIT
jgi:hypothetical protein